MTSTTRTIYRAAAGALTLVAVATQYYLVVHGAPDAVRTSIRFFSFFTILTNILAAIALLVPVVAPRSAVGDFLERPTVRTAIASYIIVVGAVYFVLLSGLSHRSGLGLFVEKSLHYVTPPLFVADWLLFVDKRKVSWSATPRAMLYPLAYGVWTLAHGAATDWYPYPFVDVVDLGYLRVLANMVGLFMVLALVDAVLIAIGRRIGPIAT